MSRLFFSSVRVILVALLLSLAGCATLAPRSQLPVETVRSHNYDARRPNFVIIHYTSSDSAQQALRTLTTPTSRVSSHYLIGRDGVIYYLVDEMDRAWHAGESYWGGERDLNSASIGIELDNNGDEPFAEAQIQALLALLEDLKTRYAIPGANFVGHADVAPRRKADPGRLFPWQRLARRGFGLWCDPPYPAAPPAQDDALLLGALGYDVSDMSAAIVAFRLHYAPLTTGMELRDSDRAHAYCLFRQKQQMPN